MKSAKYDEYIVQYVRQNLGLEPVDESRDNEIENMTREEVLNRVLEWNGLIGYGYTIRGWIESVYGIVLEDI